MIYPAPSLARARMLCVTLTIALLRPGMAAAAADPHQAVDPPVAAAQGEAAKVDRADAASSEEPGTTVLLRAVGPTLAQFGVPTPLADPRLTLFSGDTPLQTNDNWNESPDASLLAATAGTAGAFPFPNESRDAALLALVSPGAYTAHVSGAAPNQGDVLLELYNPDSSRGRLLNLSARGYASQDEDVLILGFVLVGTGAQSLLIRAVGPSLESYGVPDFLANPQLALLEGETVIFRNDDWSDSPLVDSLLAAGDRVGAFPLIPGSRDAAMLVTLMPGIYTVHATGLSPTRGNVLLEIYAVP